MTVLPFCAILFTYAVEHFGTLFGHFLPLFIKKMAKVLNAFGKMKDCCIYFCYAEI